MKPIWLLQGVQNCENIELQVHGGTFSGRNQSTISVQEQRYDKLLPSKNSKKETISVA